MKKEQNTESYKLPIPETMKGDFFHRSRQSELKRFSPAVECYARSLQDKLYETGVDLKEHEKKHPEKYHDREGRAFGLLRQFRSASRGLSEALNELNEQFGANYETGSFLSMRYEDPNQQKLDARGLGNEISSTDKEKFDKYASSVKQSIEDNLKSFDPIGPNAGVKVINGNKYPDCNHTIRPRAAVPGLVCALEILNEQLGTEYKTEYNRKRRISIEQLI